MSTIRANTLVDGAGTGGPALPNGASVGGGVTTTADSDGTFTTGTYTPTPVGGNMKLIVNGGAFTLAAPTVVGDYTMVIRIENNASAGAITVSGFDRTIGNAFTTTNGNVFLVYITKIGTSELANVVAMQ